MKAYIKTHLKTKFIRLFKSSAGTPLLFDKKPDGSLHLCVDYLGLNNLTIKNWYSLLLIRKLLNQLSRAKQYTKLDLTGAYYRMKIKEGDEWKTAFKTQYSLFEYQIMPFGLSNALISFQDYSNKILAEKLNTFVIIYLDDIFTYTEDGGQSYAETIQ